MKNTVHSLFLFAILMSCSTSQNNGRNSPPQDPNHPPSTEGEAKTHEDKTPPPNLQPHISQDSIPSQGSKDGESRTQGEFYQSHPVPGEIPNHRVVLGTSDQELDHQPIPFAGEIPVELKSSNLQTLTQGLSRFLHEAGFNTGNCANIALAQALRLHTGLPYVALDYTEETELRFGAHGPFVAGMAYDTLHRFVQVGREQMGRKLYAQDFFIDIENTVPLVTRDLSQVASALENGGNGALGFIYISGSAILQEETHAVLVLNWKGSLLFVDNTMEGISPVEPLENLIKHYFPGQTNQIRPGNGALMYLTSQLTLHPQL